MRRSVAVVAVVLVLSVVVGPFDVSYVTSDSMEPTIEEGDGYVLVPALEVTEGDVVTFYSEYQEQYVTHRVVGTTDEGYVTQGDANAATDQDAGHPPVTDDDVRGKVVSVSGDPVEIPFLGTLVRFTLSYWWAILGGVAGLALLRRETPELRVVREYHVVTPLTVVMVVVSTAILVTGTPAVGVEFLAVEDPGDRRGLVAADEPETRTLTFEVSRKPFTHQLFTAHGATLRDVESDAPEHVAEIAIPPQSESTVHETSIEVHTLPATLPYGVTAALYSVHPALAAFASLVALIVPVWLVYWLVGDWKKPVERSTERTAPEVR